MTWEQPGLDGVPEPPVRKESAVRSGITWSRYAPHALCDECVGQAYAQGIWSTCQAATHRRAEGGQVLLLCFTHASAQREADGLTRLKR